MSGITIGLLGFACLLVMLGLRIHVGVAMFATAAGVYLVANGGEYAGLLFTLNNLAYARLSNYDLAVIPLFLLMGQFATHGGLSKSLFRAAGTLIGHWKGGLAMAATAACAAFGALVRGNDGQQKNIGGAFRRARYAREPRAFACGQIRQHHAKNRRYHRPLRASRLFSLQHGAKWLFTEENCPKILKSVITNEGPSLHAACEGQENKAPPPSSEYAIQVEASLSCLIN